MKRLPIVILMVVIASFFVVQTMGTGRTNPPGKYEDILRLVGQMLSQAHYSPQSINDDFSKKIFTKYLDDLDPDKNIFLKSDIESLRKKYEKRIDDEIKGDPVEFFKAAGNIFNSRMEEAAGYTGAILQKPFDFTTNETALPEAEKMEYASSKDEIKERWRKKLKYLTLDRYADALDAREKNKGNDSIVAKSNTELEKESREKTKKIIDRLFDRYRFKFSEDDKFNLFVNAITNAMDPHTEFFPPVDKRYFDEEMSGSFFGIGASLVYDEGNIKVNSILAGSPAWKSGELKEGDIIQKVAEGNAEPVDLTGFIVTDAVKVIRGKKGTEVKLTIKKTDGSTKVISLVRDKIIQDETFARSAVIDQAGAKIGYIFLPEFYADFENINGRRSYSDVAEEVKKLKAQNVDGIVLDLRNNGGGSLYDVVQMAGLFIEDGPIVQVKERNNNASVLKDKDKEVLYNGPLVVMVNEFSASASEIFAAAIQDYGRGIIIGSTSTYGKGTVQRNIGLDPQTGFSLSNAELGTVKLTLQKFYRINGGSTQLKGVSSDIVLPDNLEYLKIREKDNPSSLPWDEINKAKYNTWNAGYDLQQIRTLSAQRLENDPVFQTIKKNALWLDEQAEKPVSLKLDVFRKEEKKLREVLAQNDSLRSLKIQTNISFLPEEQNRWEGDKVKQDRYNNWLKALSKDIYLDQAVKVTKDMVNLENLAKTNPAVDDKKKAF